MTLINKASKTWNQYIKPILYSLPILFATSCTSNEEYVKPDISIKEKALYKNISSLTLADRVDSILFDLPYTNDSTYNANFRKMVEISNTLQKRASDSDPEDLGKHRYENVLRNSSRAYLGVEYVNLSELAASLPDNEVWNILYFDQNVKKQYDFMIDFGKKVIDREEGILRGRTAKIDLFEYVNGEFKLVNSRQENIYIRPDDGSTLGELLLLNTGK